MIVADASVLIALVKIQKLGILKQLYGRVLIGEVVKTEVLDQGKAISAPGVEQIETALEQRWIRHVRPNSRERRLARRILKNSRLDHGEAESIALAKSRKLFLIVDDKPARAMADALEITFLGTAGMLLEAFVRNFMTFEDLETTLRELSKVMWLSPGVVMGILKSAREMTK